MKFDNRERIEETIRELEISFSEDIGYISLESLKDNVGKEVIDLVRAADYLQGLIDNI